MIDDKQKILAIETSGELCSVAITFSQKMYDERNILMKHIHSEKLIPIIDELFAANKLNPNDLDIIAVSNGPGSFTGLRIGMTAAKGIAFASNLPIILVPTFDALSLEIMEYVSEGAEFFIINNANIDECYYAKYIYTSGEIKVLQNAILIEKSKIKDDFAQSNLVFGNLSLLKGVKNISCPRATSIAKWAYLYGEDLLTFEYDYLEPNYLKNFKVKQK